ncbi:hypothetical protein MPSEU_000307800 [Mayamaea pseudoterrestris]|nr:hypothetical protein MPSEU_000307800 [Mayamaea pseudoterrestris]
MFNKILCCFFVNAHCLSTLKRNQKVADVSHRLLQNLCDKPWIRRCTTTHKEFTMSTTNTPAAADKKESSSKEDSKTQIPKEILEAMEEDDEFEEFDQENWAKIETEMEDQMWVDNWDDDMDDDFTKNLREELIKQPKK